MSFEKSGKRRVFGYLGILAEFKRDRDFKQILSKKRLEDFCRFLIIYRNFVKRSIFA